MAYMEFISTCGRWKLAKNAPKNDADTYYAVTLKYRGDYVTVAEHYFRYYNNEWQYYTNAVWNVYKNINIDWELYAYIQIKPLEPYEYKQTT